MHGPEVAPPGLSASTSEPNAPLADSLREALGAIPDLFCLVNSSWRVEYLNPDVAQLLEPLAPLKLGSNLWESCPKLLGTDYERGLCKALVHGVPVDVPALQGDLCGPIRAHPYRGGLLVYLPEIRSRVAARSGVTAQRALQLQAIMDCAPMFLSYIDRDYRYRIVSKRYESYFGLSSDKIIGKEMREIIGEIAWGQVASEIQRALAGEVVSFQAQFPVPGIGMRWSQGTYTPDIDANGEVQGVVVCVTDVTERKLAEQSLKDKDALYRSIFESPGVGNIETDIETGVLLRVNKYACDLLGYTEAELLDGRTFFDITHPDDRARNREQIAPLLAGAVDYIRIEKRYIRKDGSIIWVEVAVTKLKDAEG